MRKGLRIICLLSLGLLTGQLTAQSASVQRLTSLCELQTKAAQGDHQFVQVEGVYLSGLEGQYLVTSGCSGRSTSIEFGLTTHRLWKQLIRLCNRKESRSGGAVLVIFEGEFYGPQVPDPKLPESIRKNYHPGWDHMNASMTKMVVRAIKGVEPLPSGHPCAPSKGDQNQWPCFQNPAPGKSANLARGEGVIHEVTGHAQGTAAP
jgi:hypothetical protein